MSWSWDDTLTLESLDDLDNLLLSLDLSDDSSLDNSDFLDFGHSLGHGSSVNNLSDDSWLDDNLHGLTVDNLLLDDWSLDDLDCWLLDNFDELLNSLLFLLLDNLLVMLNLLDDLSDSSLCNDNTSLNSSDDRDLSDSSADNFVVNSDCNDCWLDNNSLDDLDGWFALNWVWFSDDLLLDDGMSDNLDLLSLSDGLLLHNSSSDVDGNLSDGSLNLSNLAHGSESNLLVSSHSSDSDNGGSDDNSVSDDWLLDDLDLLVSGPSDDFSLNNLSGN